MKKILALLLCISVLLLSGCDTNDNAGSSDSGTSGGGSSAPAEEVDFSKTDADMFTNRDLAGTYEDAVAVDLRSGSFTITEEGTYIFSGSLTDGSITVDVPGENDKVQIVLSGVDIYCESGAPICVLNADKVFITLAEGSENTLANGETIGTVGEYEMNAVIYSRADLTINGSGSLTVTSPAGHGISSKDDLVITGGTIHVTCANQGLDANDSIRICGGDITVDSGKDGIHAENADDASLGFVYISGGTFNIEAEGDGISAGSYMQIEDGDITVLAGGGWENGTSASSDGWGQMGGGFGGGRPRSSTSSSTGDSESMKGLKAAGGILISAGTFNLDTADDSIHSDDCVTINGGTFHIASGDDGVHAEVELTVTACDMTISEAYEGLEAESIYVRGGTLWMNCSDDGLNASGGADSSGTQGGRDGRFGGGGFGGMGGTNENALIDISGGSLTIYSGGDGVDSNGNMTMSGGYVYVTNPTSGDVSVLDSQNQPVITGGTYIGLGISTMIAETFSDSSTQGVIACTCGNQAAGAQVTITDSSGNVVIDVTAEYSVAILIISSPDIIKGETYSITVGSVSGELEAS